MDDDGGDGVDIHKFATYEDYLDSQITEQDKFYLEVRSAPPAARGRGYGARCTSKENLILLVMGAGEGGATMAAEAAGRGGRWAGVASLAAPQRPGALLTESRRQ